MLIENVAIDRINLKIEKVTLNEFTHFKMLLKLMSQNSKSDIDNQIEKYNDNKDNKDNIIFLNSLPNSNKENESLFSFNEFEQLQASAYRYNIHLSEHETTDGAVFIGYKHNSSKSSSNYFDMKIEFNPNKSNKVQQHLLQALRRMLSDKVVKLVAYDIAIDIPYKTNDVYIMNKSNKTPSSCDTTRYFGKKNSDGYLKMYDKLKERGIQVSDKGSTDLTRIEFTFCPNKSDGIPFIKLKSHKVDLDKMFTIGLLDDIDDIPTKCVAMALTDGKIKRSQLPRYMKDTITKSLSDKQNRLELNKLIKSHWEDLLNSIKEWFLDSVDYSQNKILFGTDNERDMNDIHEQNIKSVFERANNGIYIETEPIPLNKAFENTIDESPNREKEVNEVGQRVLELNKLISELEFERNNIKEQYRLELEHKKNLTSVGKLESKI